MSRRWTSSSRYCSRCSTLHSAAALTGCWCARPQVPTRTQADASLGSWIAELSLPFRTRLDISGLTYQALLETRGQSSEKSTALKFCACLPDELLDCMPGHLHTTTINHQCNMQLQSEMMSKTTPCPGRLRRVRRWAKCRWATLRARQGRPVCLPFAKHTNRHSPPCLCRARRWTA